MTNSKFTNLTGEMMERMRTVPGVESVATISTLPLEHGLMNFFDVEGQIDPDATRPAGAAQWRMISPHYFDAMGITLLKGRPFDERDTAEAEPVVIINEALARRYFPEEEALGQRLVSGPPDNESSYSRIVGVVRDIQEVALDSPTPPTQFTPALQASDGAIAFLSNVMPTCWIIRTAGDPLSYSATLQREMLAVDAGQPVSDVRTMQDVMSASIAARQFNTLLLGIFAALALTLAIIGIYGVMSYAVAQRTREIGIRMALGAARAQTLRMIIGQGAMLAGMGVVLGLVGAFALTRLMSKMLFEVRATDPVVFIGAAVTLLLVACAACVPPAWRATRVDPLVALRSE
jgi:predicted permease